MFVTNFTTTLTERVESPRIDINSIELEIQLQKFLFACNVKMLEMTINISNEWYLISMMTLWQGL